MSSKAFTKVAKIVLVLCICAAVPAQAEEPPTCSPDPIENLLIAVLSNLESSSGGGVLEVVDDVVGVVDGLLSGILGGGDKDSGLVSGLLGGILGNGKGGLLGRKKRGLDDVLGGVLNLLDLQNLLGDLLSVDILNGLIKLEVLQTESADDQKAKLLEVFCDVEKLAEIQAAVAFCDENNSCSEGNAACLAEICPTTLCVCLPAPSAPAPEE